MGTRPWNPQDLPADFKLTWHHFPDRSTVTLDANGKIARIENKFDNGSNPATTANVNMRQSLTKMNGYDTATGTKGQGGIVISDISKFPQGNADRFMMFVVGADGLNGDVGTIGGYMHQNGGSNWWIDGDFVVKGSNGSVNGGSLTRKVLHVLCANHKSGTSTLRADGVQKASGAITLTGANPYNQTIGIKGPKEDYYTIGGSTLAAMYGNRAATADEMWLIEAYYAPFAGQAIASDNPYKNGLPLVSDGSAAAPAATCRILWF